MANYHSLFLCLFLALTAASMGASENLLQNPGFEQGSQDTLSGWTTRIESAAPVRLADKDAHSGARSLALPANSAVEQTVANLPAGAYLVRSWVKSEADQAVTIVVQDPGAPAIAYTCADLKVPKNRWAQVETFCVLDRPGSLTVTLGGMSAEYRKYHGGTSEMRAPVLLDDCELIRFQPTPAAPPKIWDAGHALTSTPDWTASASWTPVADSAHTFVGTPILQDAHLAGTVRKEDGALLIYAIQGETLRPRAVVTPEPGLKGATATLVQAGGKIGLRMASQGDNRSYTAWLSPQGVIDIEGRGTAGFQVQDCQLRYGLLPSFIGSDICYSAQKFPNTSEVKIPSTQWLVGLREGGESMLVLVSPSPAQAVSLHLAGAGKDRMIDAVELNTQESGFSLSFVEHPHLWQQEALNEEWLGEYVPLIWERPFPARWMAQFFVTPGGKAVFRSPHMNYAFPVANAKTRMWGVWFEDWNHYPFFFDGPRLVAHFEKSFVPNREALIYFLEPAAANLVSPCEIVEQVLGKQQAADLFDFGGNQLRQLRYSTPAEFIYDRPVCATTTRLAGIKNSDKPTVGVHLATHLFEFIRDIRERVDQFVAFFDQMDSYLQAQDRAHPEAHVAIAELRSIIAEGRAKANDAYATPLSTVQDKTEAMKKLLAAGKGDGFDCGTLDVRSPAGTQDDLCRRYNRLVLRLVQTAAMNCDNSPAKAAIATHLWQESRQVLRAPTRWEPRRTLYFFEP